VAFYTGGPNWVQDPGPFVIGKTLIGLAPLPAPAGVTVIGLTVVDENGQPREVYLTAPRSLGDVRASQIAAAQVVYDAQRQSPLVWNFGSISSLDGEGISHGAAGAQSLQMRDANGIDDVKNWLAAQAGAVIAVIGGAGALVQPIKSTSNLWIQTTASDVIKVLVAGDGVQRSMLRRGALQLAAYGAVKDAIAAAADVAACLALDLSANYPSVT
jgi:hypothetical protein